MDYKKLYGVQNDECVKLINNNKHIFNDEMFNEIYKGRHPQCINRTSYLTAQPIGSYPKDSLQFYEEDDGKVYCFLQSEIRKYDINPYTGKKFNKKRLRIYFEDEIIHSVIPFHKVIKNLHCPTFKRDELEDDEVYILIREERDIKEFLENRHLIDEKMVGEQGVYRTKIVEVFPGFKLYRAKLKNKNKAEVEKKSITKIVLVYENKIPKVKSTFNQKDWKDIHNFIKKVKEGYILNEKLEFVNGVNRDEIQKIYDLGLKSNREVIGYYPIGEKWKGVNEGEEFILRPDGNIRKWYMDYCTASKYAYNGIILQAKIKPSDVIISLEYLPKELHSVFSNNLQRLFFTKPEKVFKTKVVDIHGGIKGDHFAEN